MNKLKTLITYSLLLFIAQPTSLFGSEVSDEEEIAHHEHLHDEGHNEGPLLLEQIQEDYESLPDILGFQRGCVQASSSQLAQVNLGNSKRSEFQAYCKSQTGNSAYCSEVERPNPASTNTFHCTYSLSQPHLFIHPSESTWKYAATAIVLLQKLKQKGLCVDHIYNWWRPEPYNGNVGGASGRHPYGTSVDVRFCSITDAKKAFDELCEYRRQGVVRALGYYGSTGVHIGVGDNTANTWGRSCN